jgi:hypothetical protein
MFRALLEKVRRERASKRTSCVDNCFSVSKLNHEWWVRNWKNYSNSSCYKDFPARHARCALTDEKLRCLGNVPLFTHIFSLTNGMSEWWWWCCERKGMKILCVSSITFLMMKAQPCCRLFHFHQRWNIEHHSSSVLAFPRKIAVIDSNLPKWNSFECLKGF